MLINVAEFNQALKFVAAFRGARARPVLACVRMVSGNGCCTLTASDSEQSATYTLDAGCVAGGCGVCFDPEALLGSLTGEDATVEATESAVVFRCGRSTFQAQRMDVEHFPFIPDPPAALAENPQIEAAKLEAIINRAGYAASTEPTRFSTNGVWMAPEDGGLRVTSTDGKRLATGILADAAIVGAGEGVVVPTSFLRRLCKALVAHWRIGFSENLIFATGGPITLCAKLVDGAFPNWRDAIDSAGANATITPIPRDALIDAVSRAARWTSDVSRCVSIAMGDDGIVVTGSSDLSGSASVHVPGEFPKFECRVSPQYVVDALTAIAEPEMSFTAPNRPITFRGGDGSTMALVMPIATDS